MFDQLHPETLRIADEAHRKVAENLGPFIERWACGAAPKGGPSGVSLYGDAIRALRQVILLDERVRNSSADLVRMSEELTDLRDRVSRLEGMLAVSMARPRQSTPARERRRLPRPSDQGS